MEIARALVGEPPLLLADEPTGNLDSVSGAAALDLLHGLHRSGTTVVIITHDRELADSLPRQVRMRDGVLAADTGPDEPLDDPERTMLLPAVDIATER